MDMAGRKLYLASDRQRPQADKSFEKQGSVSYDRGNKKDKYFGDGTHFVTGYTGKKVFEPAVDMFTLVVRRRLPRRFLFSFFPLKINNNAASTDARNLGSARLVLRSAPPVSIRALLQLRCNTPWVGWRAS